MLKDGTVYHDLGPDHFDCHAKAMQTRRLLTRLQNLGLCGPDNPAGGVTRDRFLCGAKREAS
jgi:hypothetical protein